jgi:hypothetical protein
MKERKHMSRADEFKIGKAMEPHIKPIDGGYVEYDDGWSDERVHCEIALEHVSVDQVARYSVSLFGKLKPVGTGNPNLQLWERVKALEARVTELEEWSTKPRHLPAALDLARSYKG